MKYFVIFLVLIGSAIPQSFGAEEYVHGYSKFELLPSEIIQDSPISFEIKFMYYDHPYHIDSLYPILEVNPSSARSHVHLDVDPIDVYPGRIFRIPVTMIVDSDIKYDKIFLNLSFIGNKSRADAVYKSDWTESAIIDVIQDTDSNESSSESLVPDLANHSPLKQIKSGTEFHNVECKEGLKLAYKKADDTSACVKTTSMIELVIRGWAEDTRILLGCLGDRVECYPDDPKEYRKALYDYYFEIDDDLYSGDFTKLQTINACTEHQICLGEFDNGTKIRVDCDYPIHGCGVIPFDRNVYEDDTDKEIGNKPEPEQIESEMTSVTYAISNLKTHYSLNEPVSFEFTETGYGDPCVPITIIYYQDRVWMENIVVMDKILRDCPIGNGDKFLFSTFDTLKDAEFGKNGNQISFSRAGEYYVEIINDYQLDGKAVSFTVE